MATTKKQIGYGSQGDEVKELQTTLNNNGYKLDVDGIFGAKTLSAVKDYLSSGNKSPSTAIATPKSTPTATTSKASAGATKTTADGYKYNDYSESDVVANAYAALEAQKQQKPGEYKSQWQQGLDEAMKKILNREKFSYDINGDALYQQYKDTFINQGKIATEDTVGQAAAMTGGYGSSFGQSVGQQAYQGYMRQLTDKIPELYQLALDQYIREGEELYNEYGLYADRENQDYGRYRDKVADYNTELDRAENRYYTERDYDYGKYVDNRDFGYGAHRNEIADDQWQSTFDEGIRQYNEQFEYQKGRDEIEDDRYDAEWEHMLDREEVEDSQWERQFEFTVNQAENGSGNESDGGTFAVTLWTATGTTDDNGNPIFRNSEGKTQAFAEGVNPYTGKTNSDIKYGAFSNGYQPNNVASYYNGNVEKGKLTKSGITDVVNGVTQNVWKTPDGKLWIWDGTKNEYLKYEE